MNVVRAAQTLYPIGKLKNRKRMIFTRRSIIYSRSSDTALIFFKTFSQTIIGRGNRERGEEKRRALLFPYLAANYK